MEIDHSEADSYAQNSTEIQLEDSFSNSPIKQHPSNYSNFSSGVHDDSSKSLTKLESLNIENIVVKSDRELNYKTIRHYAMIVKTMSVINLLLVLLFFIGGVFYLVVLMPLPIAGYAAGYKLSRKCCIAYMVFLVCMIAIRIAFIIVIAKLIYGIVHIVILLIELGVLRLVFVFHKMLGILSQQERKELLTEHSNSE